MRSVLIAVTVLSSGCATVGAVDSDAQRIDDAIGSRAIAPTDAELAGIPQVGRSRASQPVFSSGRDAVAEAHPASDEAELWPDPLSYARRFELQRRAQRQQRFPVQSSAEIDPYRSPTPSHKRKVYGVHF